MKDKELLLVLVIVGGALYLLMRNRSAVGGAFGPSYGGGGQQPAPTAGGATGIGTNPITLAFSTIEKGLTALLGGARPGGAPAVATQPASMPTSGPTTYAGLLPPTAPLTPYPTGIAYPTIQDPNNPYSLPLDVGSLLDAGVPQMDWTLDPSTLGFDPNYIAPPPGA
jgi:hypothetical protein